MENVYEELYEQYIQSEIPSTGTDAIGDLEKYKNFMISKERIFQTKPGLEAKLIFNIRKNLFEVIDNWLDVEYMTLENHRNYETVFGRQRDKGEDGSRKSKNRKSKRRKSKRRKSKRRKSKRRKSKY